MTKKVKGVGIMKKILTAMLAGALLLCTSCSGGESSSEAETAAVTEASRLGYDDVKAPVDAKWFDDAVFVGNLESLYCVVCKLLNRSRRKNDDMIIAVTAAACCLEVVSLSTGDVSESWTAAHHVDDDSRKLRAGKIRDTFLLQRNSR